MKKYSILAGCLLMLAFVGCGHQHNFSEVTCEEPATCTECGETQGEALGHEYSEATCEEPATCKICGKADGKALEHEYSDATCEEPATCKNCGKTEGETLDHDFKPATLDEPKTCKICGLTDGEKVNVNVIDTSLTDVCILSENRFVNEDDWIYTFYDREGNVIKRFEPDLPDYLMTSVTGSYVVAMGNTAKGVKAKVFDKDGELLCDDTILKSDYSLVPNFRDDWTLARCVGGDDIIIFNAKSRHQICEILADKGDYFTTTEGIEVFIDDLDEKPQFDLDDSIDGYVYDEAIDGFLVHFADTDEWGYVDANGNEIARYVDACAHNDAGYALVSNDRMTYSIIDSQQNIIAENFIEGVSSSRTSTGGHNYYIEVQKPDDTLAYIRIE